MTLSFVERFVAERQSSGSQDYFATRASQCFSAATGSSWIDVWIVSALQLDSPEKQSFVGDDDNTPESHPQTTETSSAHLVISRIESEHDLQRILKSHRNATFKVFLIRQRNSASRLNISGQLFGALCQLFGIPAQIRDYVMCFGMRNGESEITPPTMYCHDLQRDHTQQYAGFECIYVLRFVEPNHRTYGNPWSIRQSGIYSRFNQEDATTTWLFISLSSTAEAELQRWQTTAANVPASGPFDVHYILFDIALSGWRGYIAYLADEIRQQADRAVVTDFETDGIVVTRLEERQYLKQIEDNITDLSSTLDFMLGNLEVMMRSYRVYAEKAPFDGSKNYDGKANIGSILKGFEDRRRDLLRFASQAQSLKRKVDSASNLVSNILDLNNGNALKALALESRTENANMALLTKKSVQDAATVKVLTIITLVYLPITVVTNFFSTQFVSTTESPSGTIHLRVISQVWILFVVSVPLTVATIYIWWLFAQKEIQGTFPGKWKHIARRPKPVLEGVRQSMDTAATDFREI